MLDICRGLFRPKDLRSLPEVVLKQALETGLSDSVSLTALSISLTGTCTTSGSVT